jgi:hypothetical protein
MAHYILWTNKVHTDPPICIENPTTVTGMPKLIDGFSIDSEFCNTCFKGKTIVKCRNCPKCFYSVLPEKFNAFGRDYNLAELDKAIRSKTQISDRNLIAIANNFVFDIICPSCGQTQRYALKDIKMI